MDANSRINTILTKENFFTGELCFTLNIPSRYKTVKRPIKTHKPINISLFNKPHCITKSALERNLTANASSRNPSITFKSVIQPPDLGNDCSQLGNIANKANGNPNAIPKPAAPAVNGHAPWSATPTNNVPSIGPVQENDTIARVAAIKKIPPRLPRPDLASILFASPAGKPSSNMPKNDKAKNTKMAKNAMFSQTLVEILLNISGLIAL